LSRPQRLMDVPTFKKAKKRLIVEYEQKTVQKDQLEKEIREIVRCLLRVQIQINEAESKGTERT